MKKIEFEGKVIEEFVSFSDGYDCYCDIYDGEGEGKLTDLIRVIEGKKVRVLIEVIEEESE